jgi:hypothetical protein
MVQGGTAAVVGSDGAVSSGGLSGAGQASLALRSPNRWQFMYITANVLVASGDDYVGLGILPTTDCSDNWGGLGLPSLRLHPSGAWDIYGLTGGTISGFDPSVSHKVQLVYHYINQKFIFYLDGNLIRDQWYPTSTFPNSPNAIGFRINGTATGASKIYDFAISYTSDVTSYPVVSQSAISVAKEGGSASIIVSNGGEGTLTWTAASDSDWLTVSPTSGTGTTTLALTCAENTTYIPRTGIITITGNGQTATITVSQAGDAPVTISDSFDTGEAGASISGRLTETGGAAWMVSGGTTAEIGSDKAVSSGGASVASQATVALRSAVLSEYINISADLLISSSDDYVSLGYCPTDNGSDDWGNLGLPSLRLHPTGAWELYNLTNGTISDFSADVYHNIELRYNYTNKIVLFYLDGALIASQSIWQNWTNTPAAVGFRLNDIASGSSKIDNFICRYTSTLAPYPVVSQTKLSESEVSGTASVIVSNGGMGTLTWTTASDSSWLTVSPTSGTDTGTLSLTYTANTTYLSRTGTITITGNSQTATITVVQSGVSKPATSLTVNVSGDEGTFDSSVYMAEGGVGGVTDPTFWSGVTSMLSNIGVKQVRLDHIWDYYGIVSRDSSNNLQYDWTTFDAVVEQILAAGAKPFLCLSYMPSALNSSSTIAPPTSWTDWQAINQALAAHMVSKWSLSGLYYEVWNEVDGSAFWSGTEAQAMELYRYAVTGVRAGDSSAKVGGLGCAGTLWLNDLLDYCATNSLPVNFLSWHFYMETFYQNYTKCGDTINLVKGYLANHSRTDVEMIISEWNYTAALDTPNDAFYNAGFCGMMMDQFKTNGLSKAHFFMVKDASDTSELFGSWGAITYNGNPKPSYNFLSAYSQLVGKRVSVTQPDSAVKAFAVQKGNTLRILLWQFDQNVDFGKKRQINLSINFTGSTMSSGTYTRKVWLIDSTHSNVGYDAENPGLALVQSDTVTLGSTLAWSVNLENGGAELITLALRIPGDANLDGAVNVTDLSVLAAYYNTASGATWAMGDFDSDGDVDVTDLSMLAANYNSGSSSTLSWAEAYAQVFGSASDDADDDSEQASDESSDESTSTVCSSLGLSLIGGLTLMGLVLVKLEE